MSRQEAASMLGLGLVSLAILPWPWIALPIGGVGVLLGILRLCNTPIGCRIAPWQAIVILFLLTLTAWLAMLG